MKGSIQFETNSRATVFRSQVSSLLNEQALSLHKIALDIFQSWPGMTPKQRSASAGRIRMQNGRDVLEAAIAKLTPDGDIAWLWAVEEEMDFDLLHIRRPAPPKLIETDQPVHMDGITFDQNDKRIEFDSTVAWDKLNNTELINAVDTAMLTWSWSHDEGALVTGDKSETVRTAGAFRQPRTASAAA